MILFQAKLELHFNGCDRQSYSFLTSMLLKTESKFPFFTQKLTLFNGESMDFDMHDWKLVLRLA